MKRSYIVVMVAALLAAVTLAVDLQLTVTRKTRLKGQLEDLVVFGLLKEMTCDSNGNIFSPSTRSTVLPSTRLFGFHTMEAPSRLFP